MDSALVRWKPDVEESFNRPNGSANVRLEGLRLRVGQGRVESARKLRKLLKIRGNLSFWRSNIR